MFLQIDIDEIILPYIESLNKATANISNVTIDYSQMITIIARELNNEEFSKLSVNEVLEKFGKEEVVKLYTSIVEAK